jgi:hypothetical protein
MIFKKSSILINMHNVSSIKMVYFELPLVVYYS